MLGIHFIHTSVLPSHFIPAMIYAYNERIRKLSQRPTAARRKSVNFGATKALLMQIKSRRPRRAFSIVVIILYMQISPKLPNRTCVVSQCPHLKSAVDTPWNPRSSYCLFPPLPLLLYLRLASAASPLPPAHHGCSST